MHRRLRTATTALAAALVAAALLAGPVLAATTSAAGYTFKRASTPAQIGRAHV